MPPTYPNPDLTQDGLINVLDFQKFLNEYAAGHPSADFDQNGVLNVLDFGAFTNAVAAYRSQSQTMDIYVSNSLGNDANAGTITSPKKTILAGYNALPTSPSSSRLLLARGDVWTEVFPDWARSGLSTTQRLVVGTYGVGARPSIRTGLVTGLSIRGLVGRDQRHITISSLEFWAHTNEGSGENSGITITAGGGAVDDIQIVDCDIHQYSNNVGVAGIQTRCSNITLFRTAIYDALSNTQFAMGSIFGQTDGLTIQECIFDHNGWSEVFPGCPATTQQHSIYNNPDVNTNVTIKNNVVARSSACGIRSSGKLCENNLCLENPINITVGPDTQIVRGNVCLDSRDIASNPRGAGLDGTIGPNVQIYGNIFAHQTSGTGNVKAMNLEGIATNLDLHDNIVYNWVQLVNTDAPALCLNNSFAPVSNCRIHNNDFQQTGGCTIQRLVQLSGSIEIFTNNNYFSDNSTPFTEPDGSKTYTQWVSRIGETGSSNAARTYAHPSRTIITYLSSLGLSGGVAEFMALAKANNLANWDPRFTAAAVIQYIRDGFNIGSSPPFSGLSPDQSSPIAVYPDNPVLPIDPPPNGGGTTIPITPIFPHNRNPVAWWTNHTGNLADPQDLGRPAEYLQSGVPVIMAALKEKKDRGFPRVLMGMLPGLPGSVFSDSNPQKSYTSAFWGVLSPADKTALSNLPTWLTELDVFAGFRITDPNTRDMTVSPRSPNEILTTDRTHWNETWSPFINALKQQGKILRTIWFDSASGFPADLVRLKSQTASPRVGGEMFPLVDAGAGPGPGGRVYNLDPLYIGACPWTCSLVNFRAFSSGAPITWAVDPSQTECHVAVQYFDTISQAQIADILGRGFIIDSYVLVDASTDRNILTPQGY